MEILTDKEICAERNTGELLRESSATAVSDPGGPIAMQFLSLPVRKKALITPSRVLSYRDGDVRVYETSGETTVMFRQERRYEFMTGDQMITGRVSGDNGAATFGTWLLTADEVLLRYYDRSAGAWVQIPLQEGSYA